MRKAGSSSWVSEWWWKTHGSSISIGGAEKPPFRYCYANQLSFNYFKPVTSRREAVNATSKRHHGPYYCRLYSATVREIRLLTSLIAHFEDFLLENRASIHDILLANKTHVTKFLRNKNKIDTNLLRKLFTEQCLLRRWQHFNLIFFIQIIKKLYFINLI